MKAEVKIKPSETIIDSNWWIEANHLTQEEGREVSRRITMLTNDYLEKVFAANWEVLYRDPEDHRYWELTYPHGDYYGGGPPLLRYLTDEEAVAKYKISPQYIPEMKLKPEEKVIDSYKLIQSNHLTLMEANKIFFRISWLRQYYLKEIAISGRDILYQDPEDHRYWEYPKINAPGTYSPPFMKYLTDKEAKKKYKIKP